MILFRRFLVACLFLTLFLTGCQRPSDPSNHNSKGPTSITLPAGSKKPVN